MSRIFPITRYRPKHDSRIWAVPIQATEATGLANRSTIMTEQGRVVSIVRFIRAEGNVPVYVMADLDASLKIVFDLI